jgi:hypothetical protein
VIDFRYHALSLVAVFLALGIGIVLGVTIGDELLSETDKRLRDDLRDDVVSAREQAREQEELSIRREEAIATLAGAVAPGRLRGRRIALIGLGGLPEDVAQNVEKAVEEGDGTLDSRTELDPPEDSAELARLAGGRLRRVNAARLETPQRQAALARRLARVVQAGGRPARVLRRELPARFSGDYRGRVDGMVVYREPPPEDEDDEQRELREGFEDGLFDGIATQRLVGVEAFGTDPSQVDWFEDRVPATVDAVDDPAGQIALVLLLAARDPAGRFGLKDSAERVVPEASAR